MTIAICCPAKVNLDLRILGRRSDGYHEVRTLLQSIDLCDTVILRCRPGPMTVRSRTRGVPRDEMNLVWRAAEALWARSGRRDRPKGVAVSIQKVVLMAGGLGGGSSDAAGALRGLCQLWHVNRSARWLRDVAAELGSDVPYFLAGGLALGTGRGDRVRALTDLGTLWVVLAIPAFGVSTPDAYRWFASARRRRPCTLPTNWRARLSRLTNDLQRPVTERFPQVGGMVDQLRLSGALHAAMTGSGSTVFGLFRRRAEAVAASQAAKRPGWRMVVSRTLGRGAYTRLTRAQRR